MLNFNKLWFSRNSKFWCIALTGEFLLVNIIRRISSNPSKYDKDIIYIQWLHYFICFILIRWHRTPNRGDMRIIPGIIINNYCSISHCGDLISIVPPGHNFSIRRSILAKPKVCLPVIIKDNPATILTPCRQDNRGRRVCFWCDPRAVYNIST